MENLVFIELTRRGKDVYYHLKKKECDFVIKEGIKLTQLIQVALNLSHPKTKEREIEGLLEAMRIYKLNKGLILTLEEEGTIRKSNKEITIMPVWRWLIGLD